MIEITVTCAPAPRVVFEQTLAVHPGTTVREAVRACALAAAHADLDWSALVPGIWGRATTWDAVLAPGDRIELCRPLTVDPKVARRERFAQQGARGTGLFAKRRPGGKAGY